MIRQRNRSGKIVRSTNPLKGASKATKKAQWQAIGPEGRNEIRKKRRRRRAGTQEVTSSTWWNGLSRVAKQKYKAKHPNSKLKI